MYGFDIYVRYSVVFVVPSVMRGSSSVAVRVFLPRLAVFAGRYLYVRGAVGCWSVIVWDWLARSDTGID